MTKLLTIPKFARETGLPYRLCLQLVQTGEIPSVRVGSRQRIDIRWVEQWLSAGGYPADLEVTAGRNTSGEPSGRL
jgi:excisionase family DNA binding protein